MAAGDKENTDRVKEYFQKVKKIGISEKLGGASFEEKKQISVKTLYMSKWWMLMLLIAVEKMGRRGFVDS